MNTLKKIKNPLDSKLDFRFIVCLKGGLLMKSKVYFTRIITPEKVLEMYEVLGKELIGKIAVKLHSGEEGNQNFLKPDFWRPIIDKLNGTVVECNTAN